MGAGEGERVPGVEWALELGSVLEVEGKEVSQQLVQAWEPPELFVFSAWFSLPLPPEF